MKNAAYAAWAFIPVLVVALLVMPKEEKLPIAAPIRVTDTLSDSQVRDALVIYYARKYGVDTSLALDVSHAENWTGNPRAVSPAGAIGLMQVMPFWKGAYPECGESLYDRATNVCYGVSILRSYLIQCGRNTYCATNRYNGARRAADILSYQSEIGRARGRRSGT